MRAAAVSVTRFLAGLCACAALAACASRPAPSTTGGAAAAPSPAAVAERRVDASQPLLIGVLAPLSGGDTSATAFGADLVAAAQLAAREAGGGVVTVQAFDTGADPARAAAAARAALDAGAAALVGPAFSATTRAVRPVAEAAGATVLSFSSDSQVGGAPVWVTGDLPENEVERMLGYAASQGLGAVALVRPQSPYGDVVAAATQARAGRYGVRVPQTLAYARSFEGVQQAVGEGAPALRASGADAVLIADGGQALRAVAAFLDYNDVSPRTLRYMGLGQWRNAETLQETSLRGGWFAAVEVEGAAAFEARFRDMTGRGPHPLAGLGYDAVAALATLAREARASGDATPFDAAAVTRGAGFPGVRGAFALTPQGANRRALAIYEVTGDGFALRDPAPAGAPGS